MIRMLISVLVFQYLCSFSVAQDSWKLAKSKDGIDVYTRTSPGSHIKEFKAETTIRAPVEELVRALVAVDEHPAWMVNISEAREVNHGTDTLNPLLYYVVDLPFPFADRDVLVERSAGYRDEGSYVLLFRGKADMLPEEDGLVRMPYVNGRWSFTESASGSTHVEYKFLSDPGGSIPDWLVNAFIVQNPYKTLERLRERLERGP